MTGSRNTSKDLQAMSNILRVFGISDRESGVENHMLEFTNRYVTTIIEDAMLYSSHAKKKSLDIEDVKLAIELQQDKSFATPPSREITAELARQRNSLPLPTIRSSAGLRLPPDRHSLTGCNFHLKNTTKKQRTVHTISRVNVPNIASNPGTPRPTFNVQKSAPSPIIKFSGDNRGTTPTPTLSPMPTVVPASSSANTISTPQILMPTVSTAEVKLSNDMNSIKRPHEEDDDYDNN